MVIKRRRIEGPFFEMLKWTRNGENKLRAGNLILTVLMLLQLIASVPSAAKAGLIINDDALYIALGATYSNVGWLQVTEPVTGTQFGGSAVLIDPHSQQ
jgi:hypothetical protein